MKGKFSMSSKVTIAAGYVSDEALKFLRSHGAIIDSALGITMIELPENAEICEPGYQSPQSEYAIQWTDKDGRDRKSTRLNSSHLVISYAVFCLKKKKNSTHYCSY